MELPVLIETLADGPRYRARLGEPFNLSAEAPSAEEACREIVEQLHQRLRHGAQLQCIVVPAARTSAAGGWLPDDELTREWLEHVRKYREECDAADRQRLLDDSADGKAAS